MYENMFKAFEGSGKVPAAMVDANKLVVANVEKLMSLQMQSLQTYLNMGLNQLKAAVEVTDAKSLQDFYSKQTELADVVRQKMMDDAKALADLSTGFKADLDNLTKECVGDLMPPKAA